ncbi:MAG: transglutaminase-like domain-containing protein [Thermoanaerobaculum sp.]|nr:transglutaminase-like domain-containing protein [Thermoanaerobaculum sp.]MCX7894870.1 transglutaminase-like domain-containing protein [Thermoanaerobaculum sp.]
MSRWIIGLFVLARTATADQMQILLPLSLAARVEAGPRWDGAVILEPASASAVKVTVEQFSAVGPAPTTVGQLPLELAPRAALEVDAWLPWPAGWGQLEGFTYWQRLWRTVAWVTQNIRWDERDLGAQDARSVLARRVGRCSGRANLVTALLRQQGVPARVVHGLLIRPEGAAWHRWGEAWIPGVGWRPFDPGVAVGVVSVRYLPMTGAGEGIPLVGVAVISLVEEEFLRLPQLRGLRVAPSLLAPSPRRAQEARRL